MNMQQLMKQAQKMQVQLQKQMETTTVEATAGGGMVSVKMNGNKQLIYDQVDPEVFTSGDKDM
jgi:DNA-binding protein YbaB